MPAFNEVYLANSGKFVLLGIATARQPDPVAFVKQQGWEWTFGHDIDGRQAYGADRGIPVTVFIDRAGNVSDKFPGMIDKATFETALAKII